MQKSYGKYQKYGNYFYDQKGQDVNLATFYKTTKAFAIKKVLLLYS